MGNKRRVYSAIEARYNIIIQLMAVWIVLAWFAPLVSREFVDMIYNNRDNYFVDMGHIMTFTMVNDGMFVFMLIITLAMLVIGTGITGFYLYGKVKYRKTISSVDKSLLSNTWVRIGIIIITMIAVLFVSVASMLQLVCVDNVLLRDRVIDIKIPPRNISNTRLYTRYAMDMAHGSSGYSNDALVGSAFEWALTDYVFITDNSSAYMMMTNASIMSLAVNGKLKVNGTSVTADQVATMMPLDNIYTILSVDTNGAYNVVPPSYNRMATFDSSQGLDFNLALNSLLKTDVTANSLAKYIYTTGRGITPTNIQMTEIIADPSFKVALSYAVVQIMINSIAKSVMFTHTTTSLSVTEVENFFGYCVTAEMFSSTIYFLSFIAALFIISFVFWVHIFKTKAGWSFGDESEPLLNGGDDGEPYYDDVSDWETPTPMSAR